MPRYEPPQRRASRSPFPEGGRRDREDYGSSARRERCVCLVPSRSLAVEGVLECRREPATAG